MFCIPRLCCPLVLQCDIANIGVRVRSDVPTDLGLQLNISGDVKCSIRLWLDGLTVIPEGGFT
jgi:hypothetical protein